LTADTKVTFTTIKLLSSFNAGPPVFFSLFMSTTRRNFRRKLVLAVQIVRQSNGEKQLAHTLDITPISARLGGLHCALEPGEIIEIKRGPAKARFEVIWMGVQGGALEGRAGVRSVEPNKNIWGIKLPQDEEDIFVDIASLRNSQAPVRASSSSNRFTGKRAHKRYACSGSASIRQSGYSFAIHGEVRNISEAGVYVELSSPMPLDTDVTIGLKIEGMWIEFAGTVRTSNPLLGMGIAFSKLSQSNRQNLRDLIGRLQRKDSGENSALRVDLDSGGRSEPASQAETGTLQEQLSTYPIHELALACQYVADNLDSWHGQHSLAGVEELRLAVGVLQKKLSLPLQVRRA
jgi:hypothetical protein